MGVIAGKNTGTIWKCLTNECRMGNNETYDSPLYYGFIISQNDGNIAYYVCDRCGKYFDGDPDEDTTKEIEKDDVIITKESVEKSNAEEEAEKAAKTKAAAELKKAIQDVEKKYDVSKDTVAVSDTTLTTRKSDKDVKGSIFAKLTLKSGKVKKNSIKVTWNKVTGADGYMIFANLCGSKNQLKKVKTLSRNTKTYTLKKLKAGKYYKFSVISQESR